MFEGFETPEQNDTRTDYQVLARRSRPQSFSQLIGQDAAVRAIEGMIGSGKIPHAFLFTGTRGTGKTSSARILAKSLCCEKGPTLNPCQTCSHCQQVTACAHEDVLEIDGASHTGVDNIRELRESARFFPQSSRYKIFIIDEVHMLSIGAFNALLKTLEEPPPQVIFILATTELHKVPVTVRSRCMILSFRKIDPATIAQHLSNLLTQDAVEYAPDALQLVAREAKGSVRDALSLLEQILALGQHRSVTLASARAALSVMGEGLGQDLFVGILQKDSQKCLEALSEVDASSLDFSHILEMTALLFRSALVLKQAGTDQSRRSRAIELLNLLPSEIEFLERASEKASLAALVEIYRCLSLSARDVLKTNAQRAWAEVTLLDCISRSEWLSADELLGAIGGLPAAIDTNQTQATQSAARMPTPYAAPRTASAQHQPQAPVQTASTSSAHPPPSGALDAFAQLVKVIQNKNLQLAVKLKHAKLTSFTPQKLVFLDCPENKLFAHLDPSEAEIFFASLEEMGCGHCEVEGITLPNSVAKRVKPQRNTPEPVTMQESINAGSKPRTNSRAIDSVQNLAKDDPFGAKPRTHDTQKKNEQQPERLEGGVSLAAAEQAEESRQWQIRQNELKSRPLFKKLESMGAEIEVRPLNRKDRRH
jgi:DNA polymerase-3 subunit gamma/tau